MKTLKKMTPVFILLSLLLTFGSCDQEILDDTKDSEQTDPTDPANPTDPAEPTDPTDPAEPTDPTTPNEGNWTIIENQVFNKTYALDEVDSVIIQNCTFENINGHGLKIHDVTNVIVRNCTFRNITYNAIMLASGCSSDNVVIEDNEIYNIDWNGINSFDQHVNTTVRNNKIHDTGLNCPDFAPHAIYLTGRNFLIEGNTVYKHRANRAISVRSCGKVVKNRVYQNYGHAIGYSCDHPGYGEPLIIENNIVYDNDGGCVKISGGPDESKVGDVKIRFNTMVSTDTEDLVWINTGGLPNSSFDVSGNILINAGNAANYIVGSNIDVLSHNMTETGDIGFVDFAGRDLRLTSNSKAKNFAVGVEEFPEVDFQNKARSASSLDAGAYEVD